MTYTPKLHPYHSLWGHGNVVVEKISPDGHICQLRLHMNVESAEEDIREIRKIKGYDARLKEERQ